jgi:membrane protein
LFAFAPLLILATAVAGSVFGPEAAQRRLADQLEGLLTPEIGQALQVLVNDAYTKSGVAAGSIGALASVYAGGRGFFHLQATLNHMWGVRVVRQSGVGPTVQRHVVAFASVVLCGLLLLASVVGTMVLATIAENAPFRLPRHWALLRLTQEVTTFLLTWILLMVVYKTLPDARVRWRDMALGAAVTALLFLVGKQGIALYLREIGAASTFGAAGTLVAVLLFSYYSAQVLLFGAELTYQVARFRGVPVQPRAGAVRVVRTTLTD